jgi:NADH-quinone oxidoreductase subunit J
MSAFVFYFLATVIILSALAVLLVPNPIYSAFCLAITMVSLAFVYYQLQAPFIAGVQLIVYAGAVMVLFVMVIMMFDLQKEMQAFSGGTLGRLLKVVCGIWIAGTLVGAFANSWTLIPQTEAVASTPALEIASTKALAIELFTKYVFAFEALGVLLLLIAVGVVAVARTKGGTHGI